jgi:citrate lyase beta subunit
LTAYEESTAEGKGATTASTGQFVDTAIVRQAEDLLRLAEELGVSHGI